MALRLDINTDRPDEMYEIIIDMYKDLSREDCERVSARLILLLANHIGDVGALREAAKIARRTIDAVDGAPDA